MRCPRCGHSESRVIDSRLGRDGDSIRRRRECERCNARFTTYERVELQLPVVVKSDGRREPWDREKILRGLNQACQKRPISAEDRNAIVDRIEREVAGALDPEVRSACIGELVMRELKRVDGVAYVRFASVYLSFQDISEFMEAARRHHEQDGEG